MANKKIMADDLYKLDFSFQIFEYVHSMRHEIEFIEGIHSVKNINGTGVAKSSELTVHFSWYAVISLDANKPFHFISMSDNFKCDFDVLMNDNSLLSGWYHSDLFLNIFNNSIEWRDKVEVIIKKLKEQKNDY